MGSFGCRRGEEEDRFRLIFVVHLLGLGEGKDTFIIDRWDSGGGW